MRRHRYLRRFWPLVAAAALVAGCKSSPRPAATADGGLSTDPCGDILTCTPDPHGVCQHTCTPDPGPRLADCAAAERNYEFGGPLSLPIWTFEEGGLWPTLVGDEHLARGMYSYTDNSTVIKTFTIGDPNDPTGKHRTSKTWEPRVADLRRCLDQPEDPAHPNRAIHIQGGPFLSWGGGVGIGLKNYPSVVGSVANPEDLAKDLSGWEGISFWARRGPDSQAGLRVLVGDKYTDDDVAYVMYRNNPNQELYCERVRECGCLNHRTCTPLHLMRANGTGPVTNDDITRTQCVRPPAEIGDVQVLKYCGTPEVINGAESANAGGSQCNSCAESRCNERWPAFPDDCANLNGACGSEADILAGLSPPRATDLQFYGKPCTPHTTRNGIFGYWCFDPATDKPPAETTKQCGDHWTRVVTLSSDWQFYTVPFSSMAQQGWAERQAALDLKSVSVIRFTWDGGWVDFWIDQVSLYKTKTQTQPP